MKCKFALCVLIIMAALEANAQPKPSATLIVTNAAVYTVDKQNPKAEAVAVIGDRIVAVGLRTDIDLWRGPQTVAARIYRPTRTFHPRRRTTRTSSAY